MTYSNLLSSVEDGFGKKRRTHWKQSGIVTKFLKHINKEIMPVMVFGYLKLALDFYDFYFSVFCLV